MPGHGIPIDPTAAHIHARPDRQTRVGVCPLEKNRDLFGFLDLHLAFWYADLFDRFGWVVNHQLPTHRLVEVG